MASTTAHVDRSVRIFIFTDSVPRAVIGDVHSCPWIERGRGEKKTRWRVTGGIRGWAIVARFGRNLVALFPPTKFHFQVTLGEKIVEFADTSIPRGASVVPLVTEVSDRQFYRRPSSNLIRKPPSIALGEPVLSLDRCRKLLLVGCVVASTLSTSPTHGPGFQVP